MSVYRKKPRRRGKGFLVALGIIVLLLVLFFLSFWLTSMALRRNQEPELPAASGTPAASAAPKVDYKKLSKKELIALLEERDEQIRKLEEAAKSSPTPAPATPSRPGWTPGRRA